MTWAYILVFNSAVGTREQVLKFIDTIPEITYWYACLPNCVFLTSTLSAKGISRRIKDKFGSEGEQQFFVTEVHEDRQGWLPKAVWHMFREPNDPRLK